MGISEGDCERFKMSKNFHDQPFDDGTRIKLDIFRRYIREWISVFMTESPSLFHVSTINIFDLFCGPGEDTSGNPGSPMIIVEELKKYCETKKLLKVQKAIRMFFNDIDGKKINTLQSKLDVVACKQGCCKMEF